MKQRNLAVLVIALAAGCLAGCSAGDKNSADDGTVREALTASEVSKLMGNGINLGNTMEAYGHTSLGVTADVSEYETLWGQPVTTEEMIAGMKESGFDSIRIPVAWTNAMDFENGNYTIGDAYLDRVDELITYARNQDMYVIINDHWNGGWWGMFGSASEDTRADAFEMYTSMWTQIAERYKDYSDYVFFQPLTAPSKTAPLHSPKIYWTIATVTTSFRCFGIPAVSFYAQN